MDSSSPSVGAVVLAGGLSRRFGSDKADVSWRGQVLLGHVLRALPEQCSHRLLVLRADQEAPAAATGFDAIVHDGPDEPAGPLRGVIRGLRACPTEWAWIVACDLPLVRSELLKLLLDEASAGDVAVVPCWEGRLQSLCALYATAAADGLAERLAAGERRLRGALASLGYREIDETVIRRVDPLGASFTNVNTRQDLADLESAYRGRSETESP